MISVDPATYIITIPQADLIPLGGTSYRLDTNDFRTALNLWQASEDGCYQPKTHNHNTTVTLGGLTYARLVEIIDPYTITFEDVGQPYRVSLSGSNNNILDKANLNNVSIASANAAGLIELQVDSGSGLSQEEHDKLIGLPDDTLTTEEHDKLMAISPSGLTTDEHDQLMATAVEDGGRLQSVDGRLPTVPASQGDVTSARDAIVLAMPDVSGLAQETTVEALPTLADIEASNTLAKQSGFSGLAQETTVVARPTLSDIEASSVLAKQSGFSGLAQENTVAARPTLSQIESSNVLAKQVQVLRILGLSQENFRLIDQIYDNYGNLTSATVKTYSTANDAEDDTNPIAEYQMTATFTGPARCTSYIMKQVA